MGLKSSLILGMLFYKTRAMYFWLNDYHQGAHPKVLEALKECNGHDFIGYGEDDA